MVSNNCKPEISAHQPSFHNEDAVAGTERQHVADDYAKRLSIGTAACESLIADLVTQLIQRSRKETHKTESVDLAVPAFAYCQHLNVSICDPLKAVATGSVPVVAFNPLAWDRVEYFRLPVPTPNVEGTHNPNNLPQKQTPFSRSYWSWRC